MASEYRGESWPKKVARTLFWHRVVSLLGMERMRSAKILVLSGPVAGDALCAVAHGASPQNIIAVDIDEESIASSRAWADERLSDARIAERPRFIVSDVQRLRHDMKFDVVFLDFCCTVGPAVKLFAKVASKHAREGAVIGVGFMYGRERGAFVKARKEYDADVASDSYRDAVRFVEANRRGGPGEALVDTGHAPVARMAFAHDEIGRMSASLGMKCHMGEGCITYHSGDSGGGGSPMMYLIGRRVRKHVYGFADDATARMAEDEYSVHVLPESESAVREACVVHYDEASAASLACLYNVPMARIAAWRAVDTRERRAGKAA